MKVGDNELVLLEMEAAPIEPHGTPSCLLSYYRCPCKYPFNFVPIISQDTSVPQQWSEYMERV